MKQIILGLMTFSLSAHSTIISFQETFQIKKDNVTKISSSKVRAKIGQEFRLPLEGTEGLFLKMTISKLSNEINSPNAFMFKGEIIQPKDGKETIISSPKIITKLDTEAKISVDNSNGDFMELTILPRKITE